MVHCIESLILPLAEETALSQLLGRGRYDICTPWRST